MLLASRADEAVENGDFRLAVQLIDRIMGLSGELVANPRTGTYYPAWRQAQRLLASLPPEGIRFFRQLYDAEVGARFRAASQEADVEALRELFRRFPISSAAPDIVRELATHLIERGKFSEALEVIHELSSLPGGSDLPFERRAQMLVALAEAGASSSAAAILSSLQQDKALLARPGIADRVSALDQWLRGRIDVLSLPGESSFSPILTSYAAWEHSLVPERYADYFEDDGAVAVAIQDARRLPLLEPLVERDWLIVRLRGEVRAFDALTLAPRWSAREIGASAEEWTRPASRFGRRENEEREDTEPDLSNDVRAILRDSLRHTASAAFGHVYTIENLPAVGDDANVPAMRGRFFPGEPEEPLIANQLVARKLETGAVAWIAGQDEDGPLKNIAFQDAPLGVGAHLVAPIRRSLDIHLCVLDPKTGLLLHEIPIVGPPTRLGTEGGRCHIVSDGTSVYVSTGNGIVAAISTASPDPAAWEWRWATAYPSTVGVNFGRRPFWRIPERAAPEWPPTRPVIAAQLLVVAPVDAANFMALDRFTGEMRWSGPRTDQAAIVGAAGDTLVLCGNTITGLSVADPSVLRWRTVPLELTGRPTLVRDRVFAATRDGLVVVDVRTGKIVDESSPSQGPCVGNLVSSTDALFRVSPNRVVKLPDVAATTAQCEALLQRQPGSPRAQLALAWLEVLAGRFESALARAEQIQSENRAGIDRDALVAALLSLLAQADSARKLEIEWLSRARTLASSPAAALRIDALIGRTLEAQQRWGEALAHYRDLILERNTRHLESAGHSITGWLYGVQRARELLTRVSSAEGEAWLTSLLESATAGEPQPEILLRIRAVAQAGGSDSARAVAAHIAARPNAVTQKWRQDIVHAVDRALADSALPPELLINYLPADDSSLPIDTRRKLHLTRWKTHLALGMLDAATADQSYWESTFGPVPAGDAHPVEDGADQPTSAPTEEEDFRFIRIASRKLALEQAPPVTEDLKQQWALSGYEVIADERQPAASGPTLPLYHNESRKLILKGLTRGQDLRDTHAFTTGGPMPATTDVREEAIVRLMRGETEPEAGRRLPFWPAVVFGKVAVVPVRGGLVCVGLGPEGRGGKRLWEAAVAEPLDVADEFMARSATGPHGYFLASRPDRLVAMDWRDGKMRWRRDFSGVTIHGVHCLGNRVVAITRDNQALIVDAEFGGDLAAPADAKGGTAVVVAGDLLITAAQSSVHAFHVESGESKWEHTLDGAIDELIPSIRGDAIACRRAGAQRWTVLDCGSGNPMLAEDLADLGDQLALFSVQADVLLAAGLSEEQTGNRIRRSLRVAGYDVPSGRRLWDRVEQSETRINPTQFTANQDWLPLLTGSTEMREGADVMRRALRLELVNKKTGEVVGSKSIERGPGDNSGPGRTWLLATTTRLIVQNGSAITAFGNSRLGASQ